MPKNLSPSMFARFLKDLEGQPEDDVVESDTHAQGDALWVRAIINKIAYKEPLAVEPSHRRTRLQRTYDALKKKAYWRKEYLVNQGVNVDMARALETRELEVLVQTGMHKSVMPHVAQFHTLDNSTAFGQFNLVLPDYGPTVQDWWQLLPHVAPQPKDDPWNSPIFVLALIRALALALHEMHSKGFLHCDLKQDNVCLPVHTAAVVQRGTNLLGSLDLSKLTLIDLGFALRPESQERKLWGNQYSAAPCNVPGQPAYIAPKFEQAVTQARQGNLAAFQSLDWRIDFFSLAVMIRPWIDGVNAANPRKALPLPDDATSRTQEAMRLLNGLPKWLLDCHDASDEDAAELPHPELIRAIGDILGPAGDKPWPFVLAMPNLCAGDANLQGDIEKWFGLTSTAPTTRKPLPPPPIILRGGKPIGANKTKPQPGSEPKTVERLPNPSTLLSLRQAPVFGSEKPAKSATPRSSLVSWKATALALSILALLAVAWWTSNPGRSPVLLSPLQALQTLAQAKLELSFDKPQWAIGEPLRFTVQSPRDGYLTLFAKGAGSADNELVVVQRNVRVAAGAAGRVTLPNPLEPVLTQGPVGTAQVLAVVTATPMGWKGDDGELLRVQPYRTASEIEALFTCVNTAADAAKGIPPCKVQSPVNDFAASGVVSLQIVQATFAKAVAPSMPTGASGGAGLAARADTTANASGSDISSGSGTGYLSLGKACTSSSQCISGSCLALHCSNTPSNSFPQKLSEVSPPLVPMLAGYRILDGGTAIDPATGLEWMRCALGQTWNGSTCQGTAKKYAFEAAKQAAETLNSRNGFDGKNDWRVPSVRELFSLVRCSNGFGKTKSDLLDGGAKVQDGCLGEGFAKPTLSQTVFPDTPRALFWSSSPYVGVADGAWVVNFYDGGVGNYGRDNSDYVRLVRAGQ